MLAPVMVGVALAECVPKGPPRECLIRVMPPVSVLTSAVLASSAFASCAPLLTSSHTRALALAVAAVRCPHRPRYSNTGLATDSSFTNMYRLDAADAVFVLCFEF